MPKMSQVIAIEKTAKSKVYKDVTKEHHMFQKPTLIAGISRTYKPKHEEGDTLPSETTHVQVRVEDSLIEIAEKLTDLFDVTATRDWGNTLAKGDVIVDGKVLLADVPVNYLLFLEKQLTDITTLITKLPVLDLKDVWHFDSAQNCYATEPVSTTRSTKTPKVITKAEATEHHPAQTELIYLDEVVGYWTTVNYSGAVPETRRREIAARVDKLTRAVKSAREAANSTSVEEKNVGKAIFGYLFSR